MRDIPGKRVRLRAVRKDEVVPATMCVVGAILLWRRGGGAARVPHLLRFRTKVRVKARSMIRPPMDSHLARAHRFVSLAWARVGERPDKDAEPEESECRARAEEGERRAAAEPARRLAIGRTPRQLRQRSGSNRER